MAVSNIGGLGRRVPEDWGHVDKYPMRAAISDTVDTVNRDLILPSYRTKLNQGTEGACVGFSLAWMMGILNREYYDAKWLWQQARLIDEWADNDDLNDQSQGTSVRAGCHILHTVGPRQIWGGVSREPDLKDGIANYRWATTVDQVRTSISKGIPVVLGINWYNDFDYPERIGKSWWIGRGQNWGPILGGHAICCYGAWDSRGGVKLINTWGPEVWYQQYGEYQIVSGYPRVLLPYDALERLLSEYGEASLVTDR